MLKKISNSIKNNSNILEKKDVEPTVHFLDKNTFKSSRIFSDIGEDSAAIIDNDKYILLTTDRIKTTFIENFPFGAGFSSILVGVDDIYCCGGVPLAASLIISFKDKGIGQKIIDGVSEGSQKFQVPIIRGHTNPHGDFYELSTTMVGEIKKENYISAKNAQVGDAVILVVDFDGKIGKASNLYWDTVTFKSSSEVLNKRKSLSVISSRHLANSSKDISNSGIFGTILQLISYSQVGADININKIVLPPLLKKQQYTLETYIKMYLTTSFILSAPSDNCNDIIEVCKKYNLQAVTIGEIIADKNLLKINDGQDSLDVLKF